MMYSNLGLSFRETLPLIYERYRSKSANPVPMKMREIKTVELEPATCTFLIHVSLHLCICVHMVSVLIAYGNVWDNILIVGYLQVLFYMKIYKFTIKY